MVRWILAATLAWAAAAPAAAQDGEPPRSREEQEEATGAKAFFDAENRAPHFAPSEPKPPARTEKDPPAQRRPVSPPVKPEPPSGVAGSAPAPQPEVAPPAALATPAVSAPPPSAPGTAPGVRYWLELDTPAGSVPVTAERSFRQGERIRLHVYSNVDGYLAVHYVGSSGRETRWVPAPSAEQRAVAVPAYGAISVPPPGTWIKFDDKPGVERIFLLFAADQDRLDELPLQASPKTTGVRGLEEAAAETRGSKDVLWETDEGSPAAVGTYAVSLSGAPLVIEISLRHHRTDAVATGDTRSRTADPAAPSIRSR